jgi:hypothetical protein
VQSKILRKKLLQGGDSGQPQVGGIIGNINAKESQKEIAVGTVSKRESGTN